MHTHEPDPDQLGYTIALVFTLGMMMGYLLASVMRGLGV